MGIYALGTCNKSPKIETKTILQKLLSVILPYKLQTSCVSASTHGHLSQDCPSSSLTSRTVPFSSETQMSLPHKDLYSLYDLHPPAFQNGNDPSFPSSPPLLCLLSFLPSLPFPFFLPTPFPTQLPIGEHGAGSNSYPCVMLMTVGASCDMINKLKSFWRTENWQLEGMRANPGDIFLYHWPTGNLFSIRRMSAIWQSEMLTVRYFRTLPCLLWKRHTFTESRYLYLENLMLWHSLRLWEESLSWELSDEVGLWACLWEMSWLSATCGWHHPPRQGVLNCVSQESAWWMQASRLHVFSLFSGLWVCCEFLHGALSWTPQIDGPVT